MINIFEENLGVGEQVGVVVTRNSGFWNSNTFLIIIIILIIIILFFIKKIDDEKHDIKTGDKL